MIEIDGDYLEGGGQIVRTALALSMITQEPFRCINIRKGRKQPGLKAQHLTGIKTLIDFSGARCDGAELGSEAIVFYPKPFLAKKAEIDIGTAGSITLLLQTLLIPAILAKKKTTLDITGGTDVAWSPSIDYFTHIVVPHLQKYAKIETQLLKRGYYPKGGGSYHISIKPQFTYDNRSLAPPVDGTHRGRLSQVKGVSHSSYDLDDARVAERQAKTAEFNLSKLNVPVNIRIETPNTLSTGSGITVWGVYMHDGEVNTTQPHLIGADGLGEKGVKAEEVATNTVQQFLKEVQAESIVDSHLADMLIPFMGLFGGTIKTSEITDHTKTNMYVTVKFLETRFVIDEERKTISVEK